MDPTVIYLEKDSNDLVSHCNCQQALIAYPGQMSCPWCGCGWLFTCMDCRKAFTFARGIEVQGTWDEYARQDLVNLGIKKPGAAQIKEHAEAMQALMAKVQVGQRYVYLDGILVPVDAAGVHFQGEHSRHDLDYVPQVKALEDRGIVNDLLGNPGYWSRGAVGGGIRYRDPDD